MFTKLTRSLIRYWHGRGLKTIIYIDDGIIAVKGKHNARRESQMVRRDLQSAGFVINIEKSQDQSGPGRIFSSYQVEK